MRKLLFVLALVLLLAGCGPAEPLPEEAEETDEYEALIAVTPAAQVEGEAVSPDGRFEVRAEGASGEYVSGIQPPEFLQVIDRETGEVLWQDQGWLSQSVLWSPEGGFLALAYSARTWCSVMIMNTETWASWDFALPDGSSIPEYTFLPYDEPWGVWRNEFTLDLTVGRGGDGEPQKHYRYYVWENGGESSEATFETLPGNYDFDHDGEMESIELETIWFPGHTEKVPEYYELRVINQENRVLWEDEAGIAHADQNSLYVLRLDGEDYLLQYVPGMGQGNGYYFYQIFSLDGEEGAVQRKENHVEFDINWSMPEHSFDIPAIAAFLQEAHGYVNDAQELVNTIWDEMDLGDVDYGDTAALEKALKDYQTRLTEAAE